MALRNGTRQNGLKIEKDGLKRDGRPSQPPEGNTDRWRWEAGAEGQRSSRQDGVVYLLVGVWQASNLLERAAVALGQKVIAGRVQDGANTLWWRGRRSQFAKWLVCVCVWHCPAHLHGLLSTPQLQQVDDGVLALRPDASVLILGVVQQALQQRLQQRPLQAGRRRLPPHPPQHTLRHQPDVAGLVLETLQEGSRLSHSVLDERLYQCVSI